MAWTINGSTLDALGVTRATLTYRNAAADDIEVVVPLEYSSAPDPRWSPGSSVVCALDGVTVFRGAVASSGRDAEAAHYFVVRATGAWARWEATMRIGNETRRRMDGSWSWPSQTYQGGVVTSGTWSVGAAIKATVNMAPGVAQLGDIYDAAIELSSERLANMTLADLMRRWLGYYSTYWAWFDYSRSPPAWNLSVTNRAFFTVLVLAAEAERSVRVRSRFDSALAGVIANQVIPITYRSDPDREGRLRSVSSELAWVRTDKYPSGDYPADGVGYAAITQQLSGSAEVWEGRVETSRYIVSEALALNVKAGVAQLAREAMFIASGRPPPTAFINVDRSLSASGITSIEWVSSETPGPISIGDLRLVMTGRPFERLLLPGELMVARISWWMINDRGERTDGSCYVSANGQLNTLYRRTLTSGDVSGAAGVARAIYDASRSPRWSGTITLARSWGPTLINKCGAIRDPRYGASGEEFHGLQQISYDLAADEATFTFSETPQRTLDDLIALLRRQ